MKEYSESVLFTLKEESQTIIQEYDMLNKSLIIIFNTICL